MTGDDTIYRTEVRFNAIYVIESLPLGHAKTGSDLYDNVIFPATRRLDGVHTKYFAAQTLEELAQRLGEVGRDVRRLGRVPLVHLEAHGTEDGLMLADGTEVTWKKLVPLMGDINQACRMNLVVVAISCMGSNLLHALMPSDRAPVFMLLGPRDTMKAEDLLTANSRFYEALVDDLDLNKALEAMNDGLAYEQWPIKPATAEILFCRVFRLYLDELASANALRSRENALVANVVRQRQLDVLQSALLREHVRQDLANVRAQYDQLRETFLMIDLFPENRARFGLTFDLCMSVRT